MPELKPYEDKGDYYLWHYVPSIIAAGVIGGCFALLTLWVVWKMFRSRSWFAIPVVVGGILETVGYCDRIWAAYNTDQLVPYAIQAVLILVAPALVAASVYMVLGRLIRSLGAGHHSIVRVSWLTKIFVTADVLSFMIQSSGASLQANQDVDPDLGKTVVLVGLLVQVVAFGLFILTSILFHMRIKREPTTASLLPGAPWHKFMRMLYLVNTLIMLRSIFRIVEYSLGIDSYLFSNEWPLYTFDAEFMLVAMFFFAFWFPQNLEPGGYKADETSSLPLHSTHSQHSPNPA